MAENPFKNRTGRAPRGPNPSRLAPEPKGRPSLASKKSLAKLASASKQAKKLRKKHAQALRKVQRASDADTACPECAKLRVGVAGVVSHFLGSHLKSALEHVALSPADEALKAEVVRLRTTVVTWASARGHIVRDKDLDRVRPARLFRQTREFGYFDPLKVVPSRWDTTVSEVVRRNRCDVHVLPAKSSVLANGDAYFVIHPDENGRPNSAKIWGMLGFATPATSQQSELPRTPVAPKPVYTARIIAKASGLLALEVVVKSGQGETKGTAHFLNRSTYEAIVRGGWLDEVIGAAAKWGNVLVEAAPGSSAQRSYFCVFTYFKKQKNSNKHKGSKLLTLLGAWEPQAA